MPRVQVYQSSVQQGPANTTPVEAGNFGASGVGQGLEIAGHAGEELATAQDQIQSIHDQQQAQALSLQHLDTQKQLTETVIQAQGMNAMPVAQQAAQTLKDTNADLLNQARSPRARRMLMADIVPRSADAMTSWETHGFEQQRTATIATNKALTDSTVNAASALTDETQARAMMARTDTYVDQQAKFLGQSPDVATAVKRDNWTKFFVGRATQMATAEGGGSATSAINYLTQNRDQIDNDAFNRFTAAYYEKSLRETARTRNDGMLAGMGDPHAGGVARTPMPGADATGMVKPDGTLDFHSFFRGATDKYEGGYTIDVNGYPVNHGINQQFHPELSADDIKHMTTDRAAGIFEKQYAAPYAHLPAPLAAVLTDTAFINPGEAKNIYAQVGANGDPQQAMDLREQWMKHLEVTDPKKYGPVARGWTNRNNMLRHIASQMAPPPPDDETAQADTQPQGTAPTQPVAANDTAPVVATPPAAATVPVAQQNRAQPPKVFNYDAAIEQIRNSNEPLDMKEARITDLRERRREETISRVQGEDDAERTLMGNVVALGDNFKDVGQLDPQAFQSANPSVQYRMQKMAESNANGDSKQLTPQQAELISLTRYADPQHFMSTAFQAELAQKGVPLFSIRQVASEAGQMIGKRMSAQPKYMSEERIWQIAKPAFEASGLHFDTIDGPKGGGTSGAAARLAERTQDSARKAQALSFLREEEMRWAGANPGKSPDESIVRGWVSFALRNNAIGNPQHPRYLFEGDPNYIARSLSPQFRAYATQILQRNGMQPTDANLANFWKRSVALKAGPR